MGISPNADILYLYYTTLLSGRQEVLRNFYGNSDLDIAAFGADSRNNRGIERVCVDFPLIAKTIVFLRRSIDKIRARDVL